MRIDSHMHIKLLGLSLKRLNKYLDKEKIDYCWLLTWEEENPGLWHYQKVSIEETYEAYLKYPDRIIPFYAPDPHRKDAVMEMEKWHKKGIVGFGELKSTLNWDSDPIKQVLDSAKSLKMPIVFHMEESYYREIPYSNAIHDTLLFYGLRTNRRIYQIPRSILRKLVDTYTPLKNRFNSYTFPGYMLDFISLESVLKAYPQINFIAHGPLFWQRMYDDQKSNSEIISSVNNIKHGIIQRLLAEYSNLFADISGPTCFDILNRDIPNTKLFLSLNEDKILFGSDNCMLGQRDFLNSLDLPLTTYKKIFGKNAEKIIVKK